MGATWYEDDSPLSIFAQASRVSVAVRGSAGGTGKVGENGHSGDVVGSSVWTRPSAPECDTLKVLWATSVR